MDIETWFPANYRVELGVDAPGGALAEVRRFPPGVARGFGDGVLLRVFPGGGTDPPSPWYGRFASGGYSSGETRVAACPHPDDLCVLVGGNAHIVNTVEPAEGGTMALVPVLRLLPSPEHRLLVGVGFTDLCAWGVDGPAWRTERLVLDELEVRDVTVDAIRGSGRGLRGTGVEAWAVDPATGRRL